MLDGHCECGLQGAPCWMVAAQVDYRGCHVGWSLRRWIIGGAMLDGHCAGGIG